MATLDELHPAFRAQVEAFLAEAARRGLDLVLTSGHRSPEEQAALYAQGRTAPGSVVTNAGPGQSVHNYALAADIVPRALMGTPNWSPESPLWEQMGALAREMGLEWGGDWTSFVDRPHIQFADANWRTLADLPRDEMGFVVLPGVPRANQGGREPARPAPAVQGTPPATPPAIQTPPPAPEMAPNPLVALFEGFGGGFQPATAGETPDSVATAPFTAAVTAQQGRDRLRMMQDFLVPDVDALETTPDPLAPVSQGDFRRQEQPAIGPFGVPRARPAPLKGGIRLRA